VAGIDYRPWLRKAVVFATAYILALQLILAGMVAAQMAVASATDGPVICYGGGGLDKSSDQKTPAIDHVPCAVCAFASNAPALPGTVSLNAHLAESFAIIFARTEALQNPVRHHDPRSSQGPPSDV